MILIQRQKIVCYKNIFKKAFFVNIIENIFPANNHFDKNEKTILFKFYLLS